MTDRQWRSISLLVSTWAAIFAMIAVVLAGAGIAQIFDDEETQYIIALIGGSTSIAAAAFTPILVYDKMKRIGAERRKRDGRCESCGYDLRGSDPGTCPECGKEFTQNNNAKTGDL